MIIIDWILKGEQLINGLIDIVLALVGIKQKKGASQNTHITTAVQGSNNVVNVFVNNGTKQEAEEKIELQEHLAEDLMETIIEDETKKL